MWLNTLAALLLLISVHANFACTNYKTCHSCISNPRCIFVQNVQYNYECTFRSTSYSEIRRMYRTKARCDTLLKKINSENQNPTVNPNPPAHSNLNATQYSYDSTVLPVTQQLPVLTTKVPILLSSFSIPIHSPTANTPSVTEKATSAYDVFNTPPDRTHYASKNDPRLGEYDQNPSTPLDVFISLPGEKMESPIEEVKTELTETKIIGLLSSEIPQSTTASVINDDLTTPSIFTTLIPNESLTEVSNTVINEAAANSKSKHEVEKTAKDNLSIGGKRRWLKRVFSRMSQRKLTREIRKLACKIAYLQRIYLYNDMMSKEWYEYAALNPMNQKVKQCNRILRK